MTPPELDDCEALVEAADELQWRQVHPNWVDGDLVSSQAFKGTSRAPDEVSTARAAKVTAADAFHHYTTELHLASAGTWAVTIAEVTSTACRTIEDGECDDVPTPGHSYIDMRELSKQQRKAARTELARLATIRRRQHPPATDG